jgi:anhydro-N-acetylmuramic acid kinase
MLVIGLMSGTSVDGIDGVLVRFGAAGEIDSLLAHASAAFAPGLRDALLDLQASGPDELHRAALASNQLALAYAAVVEQLISAADLDRSEVDCVAAHGQTVRHRPELGYTIQLNNPALLAELTGIAVAADFRARDVAAGGQGAPLVPAFHRGIFGKAGQRRLIVNLGGIANVTILDGMTSAVGYDIGPANVLMDAWVQLHLGLDYDRNGAWSGIGEVDDLLLERLLTDPFFALAGPRSTGRDHFNLAWLEAHLDEVVVPAPEDVQRTLLALTVELIVREAGNGRFDTVVICGGGAYNSTLMQVLGTALGRLTPAPALATSADYGVAPEHVEALAFAWLGWAHLTGETGNLPAVTGAAGFRRLGTLAPA